MRYAPLFVIGLLTVAFWGFVFWAADAFGTWELVAVMVGTGAFFAGWMAYEIRHAMADPAETEEVFVPEDWGWPLVERRSEDRSLRHPGLGR